MNTRALLMGAFALSVMATPVLAGEHEGKHGGPGGPGKMIERFDTDKNGEISHIEFQAGHDEKFKEIDTDGNGSLSADEMKAHHETMREKRKEWMDRKHGEDEKPPVE